MLFFALILQAVAAVNSDLESRAESRAHAAAAFTPSSLPLYPLDFQDNWQASRPIPVDVNYSVPNYGPRDLARQIEELSHDSGVLTKQVNEREWQDRSLEAAEARSAVLLPYVRERVAYAHRR